MGSENVKKKTAKYHSTRHKDPPYLRAVHYASQITQNRGPNGYYIGH